MKKGVTLIELLVAMVIASALLLGTFQAFRYIENIRKTTLSNSQANYALQNLRDYIIENGNFLIQKYNKFIGEKKEVVLFKYNQNELSVISDDDTYELLYEKQPYDLISIDFVQAGTEEEPAEFVKCNITYTIDEKEIVYSFIVTEGKLKTVEE